jgi:hypothetical protein
MTTILSIVALLTSAAAAATGYLAYSALAL